MTERLIAETDPAGKSSPCVRVEASYWLRPGANAKGLLITVRLGNEMRHARSAEVSLPVDEMLATLEEATRLVKEARDAFGGQVVDNDGLREW